MCGRMAVAEISACLRNRLSSCITISARDFVRVLQLTFKLGEVDRSAKGSFPCSIAEGRECGRCCSHCTWKVSCCLQGHLYSSAVPSSACNGGGCSLCSLLNSGIHLSLLLTRSRHSDFGVKAPCSPALSLVLGVHRAL